MEEFINQNYSGNVPEKIGDRYYSQDHIRDWWYIMSQIAENMVHLQAFEQGESPKGFVLSGMEIEVSNLGAGPTFGLHRIKIHAGIALVAYDFEVPNDFGISPPSKQLKRGWKLVRTETTEWIDLFGEPPNDHWTVGSIGAGATIFKIHLRYQIDPGTSRPQVKPPNTVKEYTKKDSYHFHLGATTTPDETYLTVGEFKLDLGTYVTWLLNDVGGLPGNTLVPNIAFPRIPKYVQTQNNVGIYSQNSGSIQIPNNVNRFYFELYAGAGGGGGGWRSGGGGGAAIMGGGGGGAGGYVFGSIRVNRTHSTACTIVIGAGGVGGQSNNSAAASNGTAGTGSSLTYQGMTFSASGGAAGIAGGNGGLGADGVGGAGGLGSYNLITYSGPSPFVWQHQGTGQGMQGGGGSAGTHKIGNVNNSTVTGGRGGGPHGGGQTDAYWQDGGIGARASGGAGGGAIHAAGWNPTGFGWTGGAGGGGYIRYWFD